MNSSTAVVRNHPHKAQVFPATAFGQLSPTRQEQRHAIVGISRLTGDRTVYVHTAGSDVVWSGDLDALITNDRFISGLSPEDAMQIGIKFGKEQDLAVRSGGMQ